MIGMTKKWVARKLQPEQMWWNVVHKVVGECNNECVSRSTQMMPHEAARTSNQDVVKTNLESVRKSDNPKPSLTLDTKLWS